MALKVFNPGDVLAAADVNEYLVNTKYAAKAADTSRASTTTLTNDPDLTVAVDASKSYELAMTLVYTATPSTGDLKYAFTVPAGAVFTGSADVVSVATQVQSAGVYQAGNTLITAAVSSVSANAFAAVRI